MAKRGTIIAFLGLFIGIIAGLGVVALKRYIGVALMGVLEDELKASCPCSLAYDRVDVSLLKLRAVGTNVRVLEHGVQKLWFPSVEADFSIKKIRERKIMLSELRLKSGHSEGVGPDSATFRFVDYLAAPIPPERDRPDRWKLKLQRLVLSDSTFSEQISASTARGESVGLVLTRDATNNFELSASAGAIKIESSGGEPKDLGALSTDMYLHDDYILVRRLAIDKPHARLGATLRTDVKQHNALGGSVDLQVDPAKARLFTPIDGLISARADIQGSLSAPRLEGEFEKVPTTALQYVLSQQTTLPIDDLRGGFRLGFDPLGSILELPKLQVSAAGITLSAITPLTIRNGALSGSFQIQGDSIQFGELQARNVTGSLALGGTVSNPLASLRWIAPEVFSAQKALGQFSVSADYADSKVAVVASLKSDNAALNAHGNVILAPHGSSKPVTLDEFIVTASTVPLVSSYTLSAQAKFSGPLSQEELGGTMDYSVASPIRAARFGGSVKLERGSVSGTLSDSAETVQALATITLVNSPKASVQVRASSFQYLDLALPVQSEKENCGSITADGSYHFSLSQPEHGKGKISIKALSLGCDKDTLSLNTPKDLNIADGVLAITPLKLQVRDTEIALGGTVSAHSGINLSASGETSLQSLTSLVPMADELNGSLRLDAAMSGTFRKPLLSGTASVRDGVAEFAASDLSVRNVNGDFSLDGGSVNIRSLTGTINDGPFRMQGQIEPFALQESLIEFSSQQVLITPSPHLSVELSSNLELSNLGQGNPVVTGTISIDYAEFERSISISDILREISRSILFRVESSGGISARSLPPIDLDIRLIAPNNIFIVTNWAEAELMTNVHIQGSLSEPKARGTVEARSGWFGLRERKFEITNATLRFSAADTEPRLEILGESSVRTREGDTSIIFAEISGPLSRPKLALSSDRGLTEAEIVPLITSTGSLTSEARVGTISQSVQIDFLPFLNDNSAFGAVQFLKYLSRIDSISLEPTYNPQRGSVDPTISAQKRLFEKLYLIGESSFGAASTDSRVRLLYELFPYLRLVAYANAASATTAAAVGTDLEYEIMSDKVVALTIDLRGNKTLSDEAILSGTRLSSTSRVLESDIARIRSRLQAFYRSNGFFEAALQVECREAQSMPDRHCHSLQIDIEEGPQGVIGEIEIQGDPFPESVKISDVLPKPGEERASEDALKSLIYVLTARLRNEGYIGARLEGAYQPAAGARMNLVLKLYLGNPYTFIFEGNTIFTAADFLNSIRLFERKQPFGSNTINILLENMKLLYAVKGYPFARLASERSQDNTTGRVTYVVRIEEGGQYRVAEVRVQGNNSVPLETIKQRIRAGSLSDYRTIFKPTVAINEELDYGADVLRSIFHAEGFPDAAVTHRIISSVEKRTIIIEYVVTEGQSNKADWITVSGIPPEIELPPPPLAPYSVGEANSYIDALLEAQRSEGYFLVSASSRMDPSSGQLTILFEPGPRTFVREVLIDGNSQVSDETILRELTLKSGSAWRSADLLQSRNNLLRLGLFSRVELSPVREIIGQESETLVIRVTERVLRSLDAGTGYNSAYGLHLFGQFTDRKLFSDGRTMRYRVDTFFDRADDEISQGVASVTYSSPSFLRSDYGFTSDLRFQRLDLSTQEFDLDRLSLSSALYRSNESGITLTSGYTYLLENLDNVPIDVILSALDTGTVNLGFLTGSFTFDRRDDALNPLSGYQIALDAQLAEEALGSEGNFIGTGARASITYPVLLGEQQFAIAVLGRGGSAWTFSGTDYVPISQRYYLGGINTVRGFRENSLGPRGDENNVIGGDLLVMQNAELQYFMTSSATAHLFFDAGTVFLKKRDPSWGDMRTSVGIGARYLSPIGPIGLDLGFPTDRRDGESEYRVHFHIGTRF